MHPLLEILLWNIAIFYIIKDVLRVSGWKCFQFSCVEFIDLKIARPQEQANVINYRLIEAQSQNI